VTGGKDVVVEQLGDGGVRGGRHGVGGHHGRDGNVAEGLVEHGLGLLGPGRGEEEPAEDEKPEAAHARIEEAHESEPDQQVPEDLAGARRGYGR
jgi:hypothetical protein